LWQWQLSILSDGFANEVSVVSVVATVVLATLIKVNVPLIFLITRTMNKRNMLHHLRSAWGKSTIRNSWDVSASTFRPIAQSWWKHRKDNARDNRLIHYKKG
jgi:hypothetical protein